MEVSSGEEYYIASDNTGTPLAVFSSNGQMIKQVIHKVALNLTLQTITATKIVVKTLLALYKTNFFPAPETLLCT